MPRKKDATNLVIENTTARLLMGPAVGGAQPVRLLPGQNNVASDVWADLSKNRTVKQWLALGDVKSNGAGQAAKLDEGLGVLTDAEAAQRIARCDDVKILGDWMSKADRVELRQMCEAQIQRVIASQGGNVAPEGSTVGVGGSAA